MRVKDLVLERGLLAVVFSTRNGAETLRHILDGYVDVVQPDIAWRLIVVNNGSDDTTADILASYIDSLPLTIIDEPRPGKNVALNTAVERVAQDEGQHPQLYVFTDDDAIPAPDFLKVWEDVIHEKSEYDLFGGNVSAEFMSSPPNWLGECQDWYEELYAQNLRDEGDISARYIFGPNMAVRGSIFEHGIRFDETIGPNGRKDYAMGSETEFCVRTERELGAKAWFVARARVLHLVRPWQMTPNFFASRAIRHGRGVAQQHATAGSVSKRAVLKAGWNFAFNRARAVFAGNQDRYRAIWQANWSKGYVIGSLVSQRQDQG